MELTVTKSLNINQTMMNDKDREVFIIPNIPLITVRNVSWISAEELARELRLFSEARFDQYAGDRRVDICQRYPDCKLANARREDCRSGREL